VKKLKGGEGGGDVAVAAHKHPNLSHPSSFLPFFLSFQMSDIFQTMTATQFLSYIASHNLSITIAPVGVPIAIAPVAPAPVAPAPVALAPVKPEVAPAVPGPAPDVVLAVLAPEPVAALIEGVTLADIKPDALYAAHINSLDRHASRHELHTLANKIPHLTKLVATQAGVYADYRLRHAPRKHGLEAHNICYVNTTVDGVKILGLYEESTRKIYCSPNALFKALGQKGQGYTNLYYEQNGTWYALKKLLV
jgi:hypothetical protein